jgi:hypothetical protein
MILIKLTLDYKINIIQWISVIKNYSFYKSQPAIYAIILHFYFRQEKLKNSYVVDN